MCIVCDIQAKGASPEEVVKRAKKEQDAKANKPLNSDKLH